MYGITPILMSAGCLFAVAMRHREWRGGLTALGFIFIASALQDVPMSGWKQSVPFLKEPGVLLIAFSLAVAIVAVSHWRGSTLVAWRAIRQNRRFPLLVWGVLFITVVPNVAKDRELWSWAIRTAGNTHDAREFSQTATLLMGRLLLLNWTVLFLKDKWHCLKPRPSPHQHLIYEYSLERVGWGGTRRNCYRIGDTGLCVKFYKPVQDCVPGKMKASIRRDLRWRRFNKFRNSSSEEVAIYNLLRHTMPAIVREKMPSVCERVYHPEWGWGILETYYTNPDGTAIIPYEFEIKRQKEHPEIQAEIYHQSRDLLRVLIANRAYFHEPGNFHVQMAQDGTVSLKLIDFEPESKMLIPLEMVWPWFRALKLRRKAKRYLAHIRKAYRVDVAVETEIG